MQFALSVCFYSTQVSSGRNGRSRSVPCTGVEPDAACIPFWLNVLQYHAFPPPVYGLHARVLFMVDLCVHGSRLLFPVIECVQARLDVIFRGSPPGTLLIQGCTA